MKKNLFYLLAVTLFMGLFASCSQEETPGLSEGKSKLVSISAQLPVEFAKTRALPTANGHQLRCILEVWSQEATPSLIYRSEKLGADANGDKISFEFSLDAGNYDCLMWADFIATDAALIGERYADKYYNTSDLKKVTIKDASLLYNSDACDAFFASQVLEKNDTQEMQTFDATLRRPFAKLIVSEKKKANFDLCKTVSVSHKVAESFNVAEGEASTTTVTSILADVAPIGAGDADLRLFSCYAFADADGALKEIALTFKDAEGKELRSTAIPAGVAFLRNHQTKAKGHLVVELTSNTTVDVGVSEGWEPDITDDVNPVDPTPGVEDPKVGSFYYSDGKFSEILDESKTCVGVIFALGAGNGDAVANYGDKLTEIKGYVMAVKNTAKLNLYSIAALPEATNLVSEASQYVGYKSTSLFQTRSDYSAEENFKILKDIKSNFTDVAGTSGWYIPAGGQITDILTSYYTAESAFSKAVSALIEKGIATSFEVTHSSNTTGYISSTINDTGNAYRLTLDNITYAITPKIAGKASDAGFVRPVFTF